MRNGVTGIKVVVTGCLLGWFFLHLDLPETLTLFSRVRFATILLAFALSILMTGLLAFRWQILLQALQIRVSFREICSVTFISSFFNDILPSSFGGEVVKVYYVRQLVERPAGVIFSVFIDRYVGSLALVSVPLLVVLVRRPAAWLEETVGLVYIVTLVALLLATTLGFTLNRFCRPRPAKEPASALDRFFDSVRAGLDVYAKQKIALLEVFGITAASQILNAVIYYSFGASLGDGTQLLDFFYLLPAVTLATLFPVSLGGLGVREWTFVSLFTQIGMSWQTALSISVLNLLVKIGPSLIGATLYLAKGKARHG